MLSCRARIQVKLAPTLPSACRPGTHLTLFVCHLCDTTLLCWRWQRWQRRPGDFGDSGLQIPARPGQRTTPSEVVAANTPAEATPTQRAGISISKRRRRPVRLFRLTWQPRHRPAAPAEPFLGATLISFRQQQHRIMNCCWLASLAPTLAQGRR